MFLIELLKPSLCVLLSLTSIRFPSGAMWVFCCEDALGGLYVWDGRVLMPSEGRVRGVVAAPVVPRGCCVLGLAPARTAAVWLSVWTAGVTGRPFTPALTAICSPSPSMLVHSASPRLHHSNFCLVQFSGFPSVANTPDCYLPHFILCIPSLSVCLSVSPSLPSPLAPYIFLFVFPTSLSSFQHTQKHKHKQQQLGALIVLLWNSMVLNVKDEVVKNKLNITTKSLQLKLGQQ